MSQLKTLIVVKSVHHGNTEKVARMMAEVLHADVVSVDDAATISIAEPKLVGFGSGIYFGRFHSKLRRYIKRLKQVEGSPRAFIFSTSGLPFLTKLWHWPLRRRLSKAGFDVIGEFSCRGHDTVGPLWLIGGINRRHPNEADLDAAAEFAKALLARFKPEQTLTSK